LKAEQVRQRHAALNEAPMGKSGQLDKPTRACLLSYFSVHAKSKVVAMNISRGRIAGRQNKRRLYDLQNTYHSL
jgi:hypothetical protein